MWHSALAWLAAPGWLAVPHWGLIAFAVLLVADYTLPRINNPRARSVGEFVANVQGLLFGRFPVLGPVFQRLAAAFGTPPSPPSSSQLSQLSPSSQSAVAAKEASK